MPRHGQLDRVGAATVHDTARRSDERRIRVAGATRILALVGTGNAPGAGVEAGHRYPGRDWFGPVIDVGVLALADIVNRELRVDQEDELVVPKWLVRHHVRNLGVRPVGRAIGRRQAQVAVARDQVEVGPGPDGVALGYVLAYRCARVTGNSITLGVRVVESPRAAERVAGEKRSASLNFRELDSSVVPVSVFVLLLPNVNVVP